MKVIEYESFVNKMKYSKPCLAIRVQCFHMETRTRTVYYTDHQGNIQSRQEQYQEMVIRHSELNPLAVKSWEDTTGDIKDVVGGGSVRLEVQKLFYFGNLESVQKFEEEKKALIEKNKHRDVCIDAEVIFGIDGYEERVMVQKKGAREKLCTSLFWFWFWSLLLLSWPYRIWVETSLPKKRITIKKIVCLNT